MLSASESLYVNDISAEASASGLSKLIIRAIIIVDAAARAISAPRCERRRLYVSYNAIDGTRSESVSSMAGEKHEELGPFEKYSNHPEESTTFMQDHPPLQHPCQCREQYRGENGYVLNMYAYPSLAQQWDRYPERFRAAPQVL